MRHQARALLGSSLAGLLLLAGCGGTGTPSSLSREHREWRVAADEHATAAAIIEAGSARSVAESGDRRLVTYAVSSDDDEGPQQGAWRLYDVTDGSRVAEGRFGQVREQGASPAAYGVPDGFLVEDYTDGHLVHVATDGRTRPARLAARPRATRAGDVLVSEIPTDTGPGWSVYRPADGTLSPLPRVPGHDVQSVLLDDQGVVHAFLPPPARGGAAIVISSAAGTGPWTRQQVPLPPRGYPLLDTTTAPGRVLFIGAHGGGEFPRIDAVWSRRSGPGRQPWSATPLTDVLPRKTIEPTPDVVQGRLIVTSYNQGAWVERDSGGFRRLDQPGRRDDTHVVVVGDDLYLFDYVHAELHLSTDLGEHWEVVRR